jgi:Tfp pilus assembly protein PilO
MLKQNDNEITAAAAAVDKSATGRAAASATGGGVSRFTLKPSRKTCITLGGIMGLLLLSSCGLYVWQSGEIARLNDQVLAKQAELNSSEKIARNLEAVRTVNVQTRSELRFLESSVTEGQYVPTLLKQTEDLAKSTVLKVASLRPTLEPAPPPPADKEQLKKFTPQPYDKLHIDMDVSGKYWDVARMLYRLTEFPKILTVESMQVTPPASQSAKTAGAPELLVRMKLTGFIFPNDGKTHSLPGVGAVPAARTVPPAAAATPGAAKTAAATTSKAPAAPALPARKA